METSQPYDPTVVKRKAALVTLLLGNSYRAYWETYCQASWKGYAERHGLDLILLTEPIDKSSRALARSPAWQKCLILGQPFASDYDQLVWLDADIIINYHDAPLITEWVPPGKIGGVISGSHILDDLKPVLLSRLRGKPYPYECGRRQWAEDQNQFYQHYNLVPIEDGIIQTGVLVANPSVHRELFERIYTNEYPVETRGYEQIPLSHEILTRGLFQAIDTRFNTVFFERMLVHYPYLADKSTKSYDDLAGLAVRVEFANSFFLHFAYDSTFIRYLFLKTAA